MPAYKLIPACKDYLWGGEQMKTDYHIASDCTPLAEAWMLSCHPDGPSVLADGPAAGQTLPEYIAQHPGCLGTNCSRFTDFPLLVKLIDAKGDLSIQVHPTDEYALAHEGQYGKTEMWVVLEAEPGAFLYYGFERPVSRQEFARRIRENTLTEVLHAVPVKKGDVLFIPAGTLHAICHGIVIAEIQQNSNVTYRVFDYGRVGADGKPRTLHIDQALEVTDLQPAAPKAFGSHLGQCDCFTTDRLRAPFSDRSDTVSFTGLLVIEGEGELTMDGERRPLQKGDSLFLPACSGDYQVEGSAVVLRVRVDS